MCCQHGRATNRHQIVVALFSPIVSNNLPTTTLHRSETPWPENENWFWIKRFPLKLLQIMTGDQFTGSCRELWWVRTHLLLGAFEGGHLSSKFLCCTPCRLESNVQTRWRYFIIFIGFRKWSSRPQANSPKKWVHNLLFHFIWKVTDLI